MLWLGTHSENDMEEIKWKRWKEKSHKDRNHVYKFEKGFLKPCVSPAIALKSDILTAKNQNSFIS